MKIAGKLNKALADLHPHDRHGVERFGEGYDAGVAQFLAFIKAMTLGLEADPDPRVRARAAGWWKHHVLPRLQTELHRALTTNDGSFFRSLGEHIDRLGKRPIDPLREWICRLFQIVLDARGVRTAQLHADKTSEELYELFLRDSKLPPVERPNFEVFTKTCRELSVAWKKRPGGRPKKRRLKPRRIVFRK